MDSFGHTINAHDEDLNTFADVPFLTNDQVDKEFFSSDNQVRLKILLFIRPIKIYKAISGYAKK